MEVFVWVGVNVCVYHCMFCVYSHNVCACLCTFVCVCVQNVLGEEGVGFKIAMGAFDKTRPPVSMSINTDTCMWWHGWLPRSCLMVVGQSYLKGPSSHQLNTTSQLNRKQIVTVSAQQVHTPP